MSYISSTLLPNEKILYFTKPHLIIFTNCILWFAIGIIILAVGAPAKINFYGYNFGLIFGGLFFVAGIYSILSAYIAYISSEYGITNKRVLMKYGLVKRNSLEIILQKIESIHVEQSIFGRMFDYGTIIICGTGGSKDVFYFIPKPLMFRRTAQEQIEMMIDRSEQRGSAQD
jgi:uncharacterized membrane protein YdbT with pleckstrin-like domain